MSQKEDIDAINDMFLRTKPVNKESDGIKKSWVAWFNSLNNYSKSESSDVYKEAEKRRGAFFKAEEKGPDKVATPAPAAATASPAIVAPGPRPTLRQNIHKTQPSTIPYVKEWQRVVKVKDDGQFGPGTYAATVTWQRARGLDADGVVGPKSWAAAQLESTVASNIPSTPAVAAAQAAQHIASSQQVARSVAATVKNAPAPVKQAVATQTVIKNATAAAHQAATAAAASPPKPPSAASLKESATNAAALVKNHVAAAQASAPTWVKAAGVAGGVFAGLIAIKALFGGKRRAA